MPVDDIPVHEKVRELAGTKWGCFNRPDFKKTVTGAACYGSHEWPFAMSNSCKNDIRRTDPKCTGCFRSEI